MCYKANHPNIIWGLGIIWTYLWILETYLRWLLLRPVILWALVRLARIAYIVIFKSGYYHYHPILIEKDYPIFRLLNAIEVSAYLIIRKIFTRKLTLKEGAYVVLGLFLLRVCSVPVFLLSTSYYLYTTGVACSVYWLNFRLTPHILQASLANKKLTFQRWAVLYNSKKVPSDYIFSAIKGSVKDDRFVYFYYVYREGHHKGHPEHSDWACKQKTILSQDPDLIQSMMITKNTPSWIDPSKVFAYSPAVFTPDNAPNPAMLNPQSPIIGDQAPFAGKVTAFEAMLCILAKQDFEKFEQLLQGGLEVPGAELIKEEYAIHKDKLEMFVGAGGFSLKGLYEMTHDKCPYDKKSGNLLEGEDKDL